MRQGNSASARRKCLESLRSRLASSVYYAAGMMNRLDTIATRQKQSRVRDAFFAVALAVAALVSITGVQTACQAATTTHAVHVAQR